MKCDDLFPYLETGNLLQRRLARRHLRKCPDCQMAVSQLDEVKRELAEGSPITREDRDRWLSASAHNAVEPKALRDLTFAPWAYISIAVAILIAVSIGIWTSFRHEQPPVAEVDVPEQIASPASEAVLENVLSSGAPITGQSTRQEIEQLEKALGELATELNELAVTIDLMDERNAVDDVLSQYAFDFNTR